MVAVSMLLFLSHVSGAIGCIPTIQTTTAAPVCCPVITTNNPPRVRPVTGSVGANLDQCSVFRRFTRGNCPSEAILVCSRAPGTTVSQVVLELVDGTNIVATSTGATQAIIIITCSATGVWQFVNANGVGLPFTGAVCSQGTLTSGDYVYDVQP
ncbi:unnamed protein product [Enterobius vermicularis]|uniref:C6 domain-containing protein n=1 Tax=Enterobius vermicularis TaxID=51028 RepID=A0A0N4VJI2_ENTVE|nr:unnamed protein product [Enterobius vermicularis]